MSEPRTITLRCERITPDEPNVNGRVYPRPLLKMIVEHAQNDVKLRRLMGCLDQLSPKIQMDKVSHLITALRQDEEGHLVAQVEVLDTPEGNKLAQMLDDEGADAFEIVPNGVGSLRDGVVQEDYKLSTLDVVPRLPEEFRK